MVFVGAICWRWRCFTAALRAPLLPNRLCAATDALTASPRVAATPLAAALPVPVAPQPQPRTPTAAKPSTA
jgi:hypothetical protein